MTTLSGLTDAQIEEMLAENAKRIPQSIHIPSIEEHALGHDSQESKDFFASCSHAAVNDRILLIRLRHARDQAEEAASAAH
ncbi:MAG: hypothetical protein WCO25_05405 [Candidatus Uhrbacteria bacterium]